MTVLRGIARVLAILLLVWAAVRAGTTWTTVGNYYVLLALALALAVFGLADWSPGWWRR
jgi:hypothetical protein